MPRHANIYKKGNFYMWSEQVVPISKIQQLLESGHEVQVTSPDGWVDVDSFVDKGLWEEYIVVTDSGLEVRCNENHLFKTVNGWMKVSELYNFQEVLRHNMALCTINGLESNNIIKTGAKVPIVDIHVNHPNHRYYTNGVESHNTGVGKSLFMCHCAAANLMDGKNVLYITLELAEERVAERIDANLLDIPIGELATVPDDMYFKRMDRVKQKCKGKLIIKEYPTASAGSQPPVR